MGKLVRKHKAANALAFQAGFVHKNAGPQAPEQAWRRYAGHEIDGQASRAAHALALIAHGEGEAQVDKQRIERDRHRPGEPDEEQDRCDVEHGRRAGSKPWPLRALRGRAGSLRRGGYQRAQRSLRRGSGGWKEPGGIGRRFAPRKVHQ